MTKYFTYSDLTKFCTQRSAKISIIKKMRQSQRYSFKNTQKDAHQTALNNIVSKRVKVAIDLSSTDKDCGTNTKKASNEKLRKSCLSQKITKIKQKFRSKSLRNMNEAHNGKQKTDLPTKNERQMVNSEQSSQYIWKMEDQFKKQLIYWNNFILVPNPKFNSSRFTCGNCECTFLKIVEFVYHCLSICGQIYHIKSSHFILNKEDWTKFLHDGIKKKKQLEKLEKPAKLSYQKEKKVWQINEKNWEKISPNLYQNQEAETQRQQILQFEANGSADAKNMLISSLENNTKDSSKQDCGVKDTGSVQLEEEKSKFVKIFRQRQKQIEEYTKATITQWMQNNKGYKFEFRKTYSEVGLSFVMVVNPANNTGEKDHNQCKESVKSIFRNHFISHFFQKCCPINTPSSTYLILQANTFFQYLYQTNYLPKKGNQLRYSNVLYLKYLYENTAFSKEIEIMYPKFKYFLGFIYAYYLQKRDFLNDCQQCGYTEIKICSAQLYSLGLNFLAKCFRQKQQKHHTSCSLYKKDICGIYLAYDSKRKFSTLTNLKGIGRYTFFCPQCSTPEEQLTAEQFVEHLKKAHEDEIVTLHFSTLFKKSKKN